MELSRSKNCPIQLGEFLGLFPINVNVTVYKYRDRRLHLLGKSFSSPLCFQKVHVCALDEHVIYFVQMSMKIIATLTQMFVMTLSFFPSN